MHAFTFLREFRVKDTGHHKHSQQWSTIFRIRRTITKLPSELPDQTTKPSQSIWNKNKKFVRHIAKQISQQRIAIQPLSLTYLTKWSNVICYNAYK